MVKKALADLEYCSDPKTRGVFKSSLNVFAYEVGQNGSSVLTIPIFVPF